MNSWRLSWAYLWAKPLTTLLNLVLLSLSLATMSFLMLMNHQISQAFEKEIAGIDVVVGAKGSPMQLILSGVFQIDVPPGNVPLSAVQELKAHPMVARVVPISLGDSYSSYRIVGSNTDYMSFYEAELRAGQIWDGPMQAVLGANVAQKMALKIGDEFLGSHGLSEGGHTHEKSIYRVVGILKPKQASIDNLIITSLESVWKVHEDEMAVDAEDLELLKQEREVTMALVQYKTPMAALSFPRFVNTKTQMQAAAPALEITRLLSMLGVGTDVLQAFAGILLLTACLSVFIALWGSLKERQQDLALLRMLGASAPKMAWIVLSESLVLALVASLIGLLLGQIMVVMIAKMLALEGSLLLAAFNWPIELWSIPIIATVIALVAACVPAISVYRMNVLLVLQKRT